MCQKAVSSSPIFQEITFEMVKLQQKMDRLTYIASDVGA